jgi:hypothetical protein
MAIPTKPAFLPNMAKKPTVAAPPVAPVAEVEVEEIIEEDATSTEEGTEMETQAPVAEVKVKKERKKRVNADGEKVTPNRQMTNEDIQFIVANVRTMSYTEIANSRGITNHQVNRVLMEVKKNLKAQAAGDPAKLEAVEQYIKEHLSRPEESLPGNRSAVVKDSIDDIVSGILGAIK